MLCENRQAYLAGLLVVDCILCNLAQLLAKTLLWSWLLERLHLSLTNLHLQLAADVLVLTLQLSCLGLLSV